MVELRQETPGNAHWWFTQQLCEESTVEADAHTVSHAPKQTFSTAAMGIDWGNALIAGNATNSNYDILEYGFASQVTANSSSTINNTAVQCVMRSPGKKIVCLICSPAELQGGV